MRDRDAADMRPVRYGSREGFRGNSSRPAKLYRGSRRRIRRLTWRGNMSLEFWLFVIAVLLAVILGIPWLIKHPPREHHPIGLVLTVS